MNKTFIKKAVAVILSLCISFVFPASVTAASIQYYPIIYISEMGNNILYENADKVSQTEVFNTSSQKFLSDATKVFTGVFISDFENSNVGASSVIKGIESMLTPIACDTNGNSSNINIGTSTYYRPITSYDEEPALTDTIAAIANAASGTSDTYLFTYDWRIDPFVSAERLRDYIDYVTDETKSEKVFIISAGFGGIVANTYLYEYAEHSAKNVASCTFLNCPLYGNSIIGDIMKGKLALVLGDNEDLWGGIKILDSEYRGNALFQYIDEDQNGLISNIVFSSLGNSSYASLIGNLAIKLALSIMKNEDVHKKFGKAYNTFVLNADDRIYETCLRENLRNMPGLWALVPEADYDSAISFLFGDDEISYRLNSKIENYRKVQENTEATFKNAQDNGICINVVVNYGKQLLPLTASVDDLSDGIESVKYASAGAVTKDCKQGWDTRRRCEVSTHSHRSPDDKIEAYTCALPENTWFIKDLTNLNFADESTAKFIVWLALSTSQRHIWYSADYPQYLIYNSYSKTLSPESTKNPGTNQGTVYKLGDIDLNGMITSADARLALRFAVNLDKPTRMMETVADVDGNKKITASDSRLILRYAVGLEKSFPAEKK